MDLGWHQLLTAVLGLGLALLAWRLQRLRLTLREERNRLRRSMRVAHLADWSLDQAGVGIRVHGGFAQQRDDRRTTNVLFALEQRLEVHGDDCALMRAAVEGTHRGSGPFLLELRLLAPGGRVLHVRLSGDRLPGGEIGGMVQDLSLHRQAETDRDRIFALSQDPIAVIDAEGRIERRNPAWEQSLASEGRFLAVVHPDDRAGFDPDPLLAESGPGPRQVRLRDRAGGYRFCEVQLLADPHAGHHLVVVHDRTNERRRAEEEREHQAVLARTDKLATLGVLVGSVAHEVNNPNHFITLNLPVVEQICSRLLATVAADPALRTAFRLGRKDLGWVEENLPKLLDGIRSGSERIRDIVADLKRYVRAEETSVGPVDVNQCARYAASLLADLLERSCDHFRIQLAAEPLLVEGAAHQLEQVIVNLLINACQALDDRTKAIAVASARDGDQVVIEVSDEGPGIPAHIRERIGRAFVTTKAQEGGTGLGLAVVRRILDQHGGALDIECPAAGGTLVRVRLPAAAGA